ncbi:hypothetical protein GCM10029964_112370 [Kibdelosporangium lantanae]
MTRDELDVARWRGFSHADLYTLLQNGPGAGASATPAGRWAAVSAALNDIHHDLSQVINQARSMWAGDAANAAFAQLSEIADWAAPAADAAAHIQSAMDQQAESMGRVRAAMPAPSGKPTPEPDPLLGPVLQVVGLQSDHERIDLATTDDARKAFQAMLAYQNDTTATMDALPAYPEPVNAAGHKSQRDHNLLNVLGITTTPAAAAAAPLVNADVPAQQSPAAHWGRTDSVTQSGFSGTLTPDVEFRRPVSTPVAPLEPGAMSAMDPFAPVGSTSQQETRSTSRRNGAAVPKVTTTTPDPLMAPPGVAGSSATPATTTSGVSSVGGGTDRVLARREPLMPGWTGGDAVEPVQQAQRRRDRRNEKITESVDGADTQVPPPVIGTEPYRQ